LQVNGRDFLVRGADYAPDLLFRFDPQAEVDTIEYVKDLGLNMIRWEGKISSEHMIELADRAGIRHVRMVCGSPLGELEVVERRG